VLLLYGCEFRSSNEDVLIANKRIVAIEARKLEDGPTAGQGGDIVVVDIETGKKFYATNDYYINTNPQWSPDGRSVIYITNREGNSRWSRNFLGGEYRNKLYLFNLDTKNLTKIQYEYAGELKHTHIHSLFWSKCNDSLYFRASTYKRDSAKLITAIFKLSPSGGLAEKVVELERTPRINNFVVTASERYIFYDYLDHKNGSFIQGINLYDMQDSLVHTVIDGPGYTVNDVSEDGESILISDKTNVYEYEIYNNTFNFLFCMPGDFIFPDPRYIGKDEIVLFVHRPVDTYPDNYLVELARYNRNTNEFVMVSNKRLMWVDMDVYFE
jgi:Tol biopolymer transport system component